MHIDCQHVVSRLVALPIELGADLEWRQVSAWEPHGAAEERCALCGDIRRAPWRIAEYDPDNC